MFLRDRGVGVLIVGIIWVTSQIGFSNVKHDYFASQWYKYQTAKGGFEDSKVAIWIWEKKEVEDHWKSLKTEPQTLLDEDDTRILNVKKSWDDPGERKKGSSVFDASNTQRYR